STSTIVDASLVPQEKITAETREVTLAKKQEKVRLPIAIVHLDTPYFEGETEFTNERGEHQRQVVVPKSMRNKVLALGHDSPMAAHLGRNKTLERVRQEFYWPGMYSDQEGEISEDEQEEYAAIVVEDYETEESDQTVEETPGNIQMPSTKQSESVENIHIREKLDATEVKEIKSLCEKYSNNFSDVPLTTTLEECSLKMSEEKPVFVRMRPIPHSQVEVVEREVDDMLNLGVIEPAASPYNAPIVLVKKKGQNAVRFCNDFRELNKVTEFDAEPITDVEHLFASLSKAKFFSKLDLTKGYWAIPIKEEDRDKTAFTTPRGQFRWVTMPFGLKTAGSVFNRMMRKLLGPLKRNDVPHFMDDILIATETWEEHLEAVEAVLRRLEEANLAAKPSKCYFGFDQLTYLGHEIGNGKMWPENDKIEKVQQARPPTTKKELRAFLGLSGFYRQYIHGYATIALPLTEQRNANQNAC
ncbi:hypothetical protein BaRGS_00016659, partial [Batillaria attramentaria]